MLLGDSWGNPVGYSLPFDQIRVERPDLGPGRENLPLLLERCRKDGVLHGENESTVRRKASVERTQQLRQVFDVVQCERAVNQVERRCGKSQMLNIRPKVR